jgi:hypothetical protein
MMQNSSETMKDKKVAQCLSRPQRKQPSIQNPMAVKVSFRNEGEIQTFLDAEKLIEFATRKLTLYERPKDVILNRKEIIEETAISERKKNILRKNMGNILGFPSLIF